MMKLDTPNLISEESAKLTLLVVLIAVSYHQCVGGQFQEQPPAGPLFISEKDRVTLSCSLSVGYFVDWEVRFENGVTLEAARTIHEVTFMQRNFTFVGLAAIASTLSFGILSKMESQTNNATTVTCVAQQGVSTRIRGNAVQVFFYGAPPTPTDLRLAEIETGFLNISWSLEFIEEVQVNYTLNVTNLNVMTNQSMIIAGLRDQYYVSKLDRLCDTYNFTVVAVSAAGMSPSQTLIFTRDSSNECSGTTIEIVTTTDATTFKNNAAIGVGAIAGIVTIIIIVPIGVIVAAIIIILTCRPTKKPTNLTLECTSATITAKWDHKKKHEEAKDAKEQKTKQLVDVAADISNLDTAKLHQETRVSLAISTTPGQVKPNIRCYLMRSRDNFTIEEVPVVPESPQKQSVIITPREQGRYMLKVTVNNRDIKGSPFHFEVGVPLKKLNLKAPVGLTTSQAKVFVLDQKEKGIRVFENLKQTSFINLGRKDLVEIAVHNKTGNMFVSTGDTGEVLKLDSTGKLIKSARLPHDDKFEKYFSNGLSINSKNELYVCDTVNNRIVVFDLKLNHSVIITSEKCKYGPLQSPRDVEFDKHNNVYISENKRIRILSHNKTLIEEVKVLKPVCLKLIGNTIFVTDEGGRRVTMYSVTDRTHIRDIYKDKTMFDTPKGITVDNEGYVYVSTSRQKLLIL